MDDDRIDALIEASSLGTPAAKAARESVSDEEAQRIVDRVNELIRHREPVCATCGHDNHDDEPACGHPDPQYGFCLCPVNAT